MTPLVSKRIVIAAALVGYVGVLLGLEQLRPDFTSPRWILVATSTYLLAVIAGSFVSEAVRARMDHAGALATWLITGHGLYLLSTNHLAPILVAPNLVILLSPAATFGYVFRRRSQIAVYLVAAVIAAAVAALVAVEPEGEPAIFLASYVVLAIVCYVMATAQLDALRRLEQSEKRSRALLEASPDTVVRFRSDGTLLDVVADPTTALGALFSGSEGRALEDLLGADLAGAALAVISAGTPTTHEGTLQLDDGSPLHVEARVVPSGKGELTTILRDVTEQKELAGRLIVADRMAALGTLAAGVGHEINNPLTYIMANLEFTLEALDARDDTESLGPVVEALEGAQEGAKHVRAIVAQLRQGSRADDGSGVSANVSTVLELACEIANNEIRHRGRLVSEIEQVPRVAGKESRLLQVFMNLLVNAAQALDPDRSEDNEIVISARSSDSDWVVVEVRDNGPGIPEEVAARVFEPFFTTKPVGQGSGLGLYVCHQIVTACGGELTIEGRPGEGTTVRVRLPVSDEQALIPSVHPAPRGAGPRRVLVVDDDPAVAKAIARLLRNHDVTISNDPHEALEVLSTDDFDVVLCDLMMPRLDGMELYRRVREKRPEIGERIVFLTGGAFTPEAQSFLENVENRYLYKPVDSATLRELVDAA